MGTTSRPAPGLPFPQREGWFLMLLRHVTLKRNLPSIGRHGLLCSKSQGRLPVVWLHAASKSPWAVLHTIKRHGGRVEGVVIIEVDVPRSWLRKSRKRLWYCAYDVPPHRFGRLISTAELAGPSVDDIARTPKQAPVRLAC
jgi:hypothetical protein